MINIIDNHNATKTFCKIVDWRALNQYFDMEKHDKNCEIYYGQVFYFTTLTTIQKRFNFTLPLHPHHQQMAKPILCQKSFQMYVSQQKMRLPRHCPCTIYSIVMDRQGTDVKTHL